MQGALAICDAHAAACRAVALVTAAHLDADGLHFFTNRTHTSVIGWKCVILHAFAYYVGNQ